MSQPIPELLLEHWENNTIPHNARALSTELCAALNKGLREGPLDLGSEEIDLQRRHLQDFIQSCFGRVHGRIKWGQFAVIPAVYQFAALQAERQGHEKDAEIFRKSAECLIEWGCENGMRRDALQLTDYGFKELKEILNRKTIPSLKRTNSDITWEMFAAAYGQQADHRASSEPDPLPSSPADEDCRTGQTKADAPTEPDALQESAAPFVLEMEYSFGPQLTHLRAHYRDNDFPHGLTEHDLAEKLNTQIETEVQVTSEHVCGWERNEQLEVLAQSPELFEALQYVLIDLNDTIPDAQKEKSKGDLSQLFAHVKTQLDLPVGERNRFMISAFGTALSSLRAQAKMTESDVAEYINLRTKEANPAATVRFTVQDIVDFQTGEKDPDERTIARLASVLGDNGKLHKAWKAENAYLPQKMLQDYINDFKDKMNREVVTPLEELMDEYGIGFRSNARVHGHLAHLFPEPRGSNFSSARNTMENWLGDMREILTEQRHRLTKGRDANYDKIDPQVYEPLLKKWHTLHEQYLAIRARQEEERNKEQVGR